MRLQSEPMMPAPAAAAGYARQIARIALWLFLSLAVLYVLLGRGHFIGTDEIAVYQATRSLWEHGDLRVGAIPNTAVGRAGLTYSVFSIGQSIAALPLYGLAQIVRATLTELGATTWLAALAGPSVGTEPSRWGGDLEIFFVVLFNAAVIPALCGVFFAFSLRLGASIRSSALAAALLGLTSYVAPSSTMFLQHPAEALFLLWTFYFLFMDARAPDWRSRAAAGTTLALSIMLRWESVIAVPWLGLYLLWSAWRRRAPRGLLATTLAEVPAFAAPLMVGLAFPPLMNWVRFESVLGVHGDVGFNSPFPTGLYTFLFSSGDSVFIYTPLLLLLGAMFPPFWRAYRAEAVLVAALAMFYLLFYSSYRHWHGLWSDLGPRFLLAMMPFLLLPLARWMDMQSPRRLWATVGPLAAVGAWVQLVHFATNFSYVSYREGYVVDVNREIPWDFLFRPDRAPILAHSRALLAWDYRVDLWLVNIYRFFGLERALLVGVPLALLLAFCTWRLVVALREVPVSFPRPEDLDFTSLVRPAAVVLGGAWALTLLGLAL